MWYEIKDINFKYPIPLEDTKGGIFMREEACNLHRRWIRKHIEFIETSKNEIEEQLGQS